MVMISTVIQIDTYNQRKCSFPPHPLIQSPKRGKLIIGLYMKLTGRHSRPLAYLPVGVLDRQPTKGSTQSR
jgi:hypothetical protein